eukprot:9047515-Pyramimonas_sp.AAC.1
MPRSNWVGLKSLFAHTTTGSTGSPPLTQLFTGEFSSPANSLWAPYARAEPKPTDSVVAQTVQLRTIANRVLGIRTLQDQTHETEPNRSPPASAGARPAGTCRASVSAVPRPPSGPPIASSWPRGGASCPPAPRPPRTSPPRGGATRPRPREGAGGPLRLRRIRSTPPRPSALGLRP